MSLTIEDFIARFTNEPVGAKKEWHSGKRRSPAALKILATKLPDLIGFDQHREAFENLAALIDQAIETTELRFGHFSLDATNLPSFKAIKSKRDQLPAVMLAIAQTLVWRWQTDEREAAHVTQNSLAESAVRQLLNELRERKISFTAEQVATIVRLMCTLDPKFYFAEHLTESLTPILDRHRDYVTLTSEQAAKLSRLRDRVDKSAYDKKSRVVVRTLDELVSAQLGQQTGWRFRELGDVEKSVNAEIDALDGPTQQAVNRLLAHACECHHAKPSTKWISEARQLLHDNQACVELLAGWIKKLVEAGGLTSAREHYQDKVDYQGFAQNLDATGGLVWLLGISKDARAMPLLVDMIEGLARAPAARKVQCFGLAGAAVRAVAAGDPPASLSYLSRLELRVRWPKAKKIIRKIFDEAIVRSGMSKDDVVETLVPEFEMTEGITERTFDDTTARVVLGKWDKPSVTWILPGGKTARSAPKAVKQSHPQAAESIKQLVNDVEKMRAAQRTRLDLLFRRTRAWTFADWSSRYHNHGLISTLSRRLLWSIDETPVIWHDGALCDINGSGMQFGQTAEVKLWHPVGRSTDEIVAWRDRLAGWEITQPFKQAHREVYILTDAELNTRLYSNRFAAHILKAGTMLAITQARGWKAGLYGGFGSNPSLVLPDYDLRAEWWVQQAGDEYAPYGGPLYLSTDQVRFYRGESPDPLPIQEIQPLPFSEVMRDVDLFVGVASVGNDPNWQDGGPQGRWREYWQGYSFGELNATATTRKQVLQRLLPRLRIADKCSLSDRFLVVKGQLRTYKIHLGSGNILMEPNDQYLCIVPDASTRNEDSNLFLPFEGDSTLSIILSKAMLLSDDTSISDSTITRQIKGR